MNVGSNKEKRNFFPVMFAILFKSVSQTLLPFGQNEPGGKLGFVATLHTWDQKLNAHFHLHCLVAGGALSPDGSTWLPCKGNYLFNNSNFKPPAGDNAGGFNYSTSAI